MTGTERVARASAARDSAAHAGNSSPHGTSGNTTTGTAGSAHADLTADPASPADAGPSLTERRKAATRMEIARAAAGLFMRHGLRATRAEDIARAAGVAPRTFYRYFAAKEEALGPLFSAGVERWAEAVRDAPADLSVPDALRHAVVRTLTPGVGVRAESMEWVRSLLRLAEESPALRRVWGEACQGAEQTLAEVLTARLSQGEGLARGEDAVERAAGGAAGTGGADASGIRLSAAVAGAAVRVAVETWAAGDDPADGPAGPVPRALRHLEALRDFPWGTA